MDTKAWVLAGWLLCLGAGWPGAAMAQGQAFELEDTPGECGDQVPAFSQVERIDLLDPDLDAARKHGLAERLRLRVADGCPYEHYLLGTLLRFGPDLRGNPLARDEAEAARLLEAYGLRGYVRAYADLAEMALARNDGRAAMLWTQVYLHFATRLADRLRDFDRRGYNANLLARATVAAAPARLGRAEINRMLGAYLAEHGDGILAKSKDFAYGEGESSEGDGSAPELVMRKHPGEITASLGIDAGYAVFLLEVQPDGRVSRVVAESFGPTPRHAERLKALVRGFEFEPFDWHEPQVGRAPVEYGYADWGPRLKR